MPKKSAKKPAKKPPARKRTPRRDPELARPHALTLQQERFVDEYILDLNATQAALRAGYAPSSAGSVGSSLLAQPHIAAAVFDRIRIRQQRVGISQDYILERLKMEIEYYGEQASHAARVSAIRDAMRHLGMFAKDQVTIAGSPVSPVQVQHTHGVAPVVIDADKLPDDLCRRLLEYRRLGQADRVEQELREHAGVIDVQPQ